MGRDDQLNGAPFYPLKIRSLILPLSETSFASKGPTHRVVVFGAKAKDVSSQRAKVTTEWDQWRGEKRTTDDGRRTFQTMGCQGLV